MYQTSKSIRFIKIFFGKKFEMILRQKCKPIPFHSFVRLICTLHVCVCHKEWVNRNLVKPHSPHTSIFKNINVTIFELICSNNNNNKNFDFIGLSIQSLEFSADIHTSSLNFKFRICTILIFEWLRLKLEILYFFKINRSRKRHLPDEIFSQFSEQFGFF